MRDDQHNSGNEVAFFLTPPHPCSYLHKANAQTLFVDPRRVITSDLYQGLTDQGFRRSGSHLYRPRCTDCQACIPLRIPVADFIPRRQQKRVAKKNADLRLEVEDARFSRRPFHLYERYISVRHADGDMFPASEDQFRAFLLSPWSKSIFVSLYDRDRLLSVAVTDVQSAGLSAIYTFFEPSEKDRSLGTFSILTQIALCRQLELPYLYLGYWVKDCQKMNYKTGYRPTEMLINDRWVTLN